jgi:hypothetical protein
VLAALREAAVYLNDELGWTKIELIGDVTPWEDSPEEWTARIHRVDYNEEVQGLLLEATVYRAHLGGDWFGLMDSVDGKLAWAAEAFVDPERIEELDPDSVSTQALSIIYAVKATRGFPEDDLTAELVSTLARVFDNDVIAVASEGLGLNDKGKVGRNEPKQHAFERRWGALGFVAVPGFEAMMLPSSARAAVARISPSTSAN